MPIVRRKTSAFTSKADVNSAVMQSRADQRRRAMFDQGSAAFAKFRPDVVAAVPGLADGYVCPQCLRAFPRASLNSPQRLTIEHVPPKGAYKGPYSYVLICRDCNSTAGTKLDSHLQERRESQLPPEGPMNVTFDFSGDRINGTMERMPDGQVQMVPDWARSDPEVLRAVHDRLDLGEVDQFDVEGSYGFRLGRPETALLRVAYLMSGY